MILRLSWYHLSFRCHEKARMKPGANAVTQRWLIFTRMQLYACGCSGSIDHRCTDHILKSTVCLHSLRRAECEGSERTDGETLVQNKVRNIQGCPHWQNSYPPLCLPSSCTICVSQSTKVAIVPMNNSFRGHSHLQHGFTVMWTAERTLKVTIISWQFLLLAEFMVTRLLNPALCMADFPADGSEPAHVEIRDCTSDMGSLWIKSARRGPSDTACCERAQPVCLAATHTEGCQPWDTVELFKDVSPGREEGAVWASSITSITTANPSAAAIWIQLEQVSCTPYSWATAPKAGFIRTFQTPGLCEILTSSLMAQRHSLYFFLFCNNRKSEWYFLGLLIQFYLYLVSYRCPCDEHHHSHCFCLEMESLQDLPPQNGILHPWNLYITETGNWQR